MRSEKTRFLYESVLDDLTILVVDDWSFPGVRRGRFDGLKGISFEVLYELTVPSSQCKSGELGVWWNGYYIAILKRL